MLQAPIPDRILQNRPLFSLICRFNCQPARYIHRDRLVDAIDPELLAALVHSRRGERWLSTWIADRFELESAGLWDFDDDRRRLALLDFETLTHLAAKVGTVMCQQQIACVVDRDGQRQLRESLGEDLYLFAIKRASFLVKNVPPYFARPLGTDPVSQLAGSGRLCMAACLAGEPVELWKRFSLKFPEELPSFDESMSDSGRLELWKTLRRILLSEVNPNLAPCFS